jgi:orotidine-5'-phosphate decarboxylase
MSEPAHFADRLTARIREKGTPGVVGIDPVLERLPAALQPQNKSVTAAVSAIESFSRAVLEAVHPVVPAVKINVAFFETFHEQGLAAYFRLIAHAHRLGLLVIGDIKRGDIGSTAKLYARGHLEPPPFLDVPPEQIPDAVTLAGYLGENAVRAFIDAARENGRGIYVLVRPSDPGADEVHDFGDPLRFYQHMAALVHRWGSEESLIGECGLSAVGAVVAAKDHRSTAALRAQLPQTPLLVPGYGAQGSTAEDCRPCFRADGTGAVINASRSVIYAFSKPGRAAQRGDDWQAAIADACRAFAADVASCVAGA